MAPVLQEVLAANEAYAASFGDKGKLAMPPARRFAILTCMDARLDPAKYAGLAEGDAHVIRNAGGRATDDAIRSFVISTKLLGTREWFVIHHTNCGMETFTDQVMGDLLAKSSTLHSSATLAGATSARARARSTASSSNGTRSATSPEAWLRMLCASATIRWCRRTSRSMATFTMLGTAAWWRSRRRLRPDKLPPEQTPALHKKFDHA